MTLSEFIYLAEDPINGLSTIGTTPPTDVILLYNYKNTNPTRTTIQAVAINTANYNLRELERVSTVHLTPSGSQTVINISLSDSDAPYRRINKVRAGDYFIYEITPANQEPTVATTDSKTTGTVFAATENTIVYDSIGLPNQQWTGQTIKITAGPGFGQARRIETTDNSTATFTISPDWTTIPDNTSTFEIYADPQFTTKLLVEYVSAKARREGQDYEVLLPTVMSASPSANIYKSDKTTLARTSVFPNQTINLKNILAKEAPFATVQDSNYSSTPWKNPRYDGSIITSITNQGFPPFAHGSFLEGTHFSKETSDSYIDNLISMGNVEYKQYFSISDLDVPQYLTTPLNLKTTADISLSSSIIQLATDDRNLESKDIYIDDILFLQLDDTTSPELVRVVPPNPPAAYYPYEFKTRTTTSGEYSSIKIARGYSNTPRSSYLASSSLSRVVPVRILDLTKSTLTPVPEGKFRIKGRADTLYLSIDGYVISGSGTSGL